jgi:uncharacterized protein (TIGR02266 family)
LVDPNTRQGKRTPVTLKIKFKSETLEQFIERYAVDVSQGGIFIRTKEPLAVGTQMKFEFQLRDASPLIAGEGTVVWTRENDPSRPAIAPGMGVRFDRLADGSQGILERILTEKAKQAPQRPITDTAKPPLFTDAPTRVAPAPIQEALLGKESGQRRRAEEMGSDSHTPLPRPMPFHTDADEFPDEAFEEATKVRALDELIAQTAEGGTSSEEVTGRRPNGRDSEASNEVTKLAAQIVEPDDLPEPPETARPQPKLLDTSPSPRLEPAAESSTRMRAGLEPTRGRATPPAGEPALEDSLLPSNVRAVTAEQTEPARMPAIQERSKAPIFLLLLLVLAAGGAAVWFLVIRPQQLAEQEVAAGSQAPGSAGSAVATPGSAGSAGPAVAIGSGETPAGSNAAPVELVDTVIAASVEGATVAIAGTDQTGPAPFTAKLDKDKPHKARVTAKGFLALELDVKGGDDKQTATLVAKPRVIMVQSEPSGALIFVDGSATGHTTPYEVELTTAQSAKKSVRIQLRKSGYRSLDRTIELAKMIEDDARMTAKLSERLSVQPAPIRNSASTGSATTGQGSDAGAGAGSDGPAVVPSEGSAGGTTGSAAPSTGSATEPEPDFTKQP